MRINKTNKINCLKCGRLTNPNRVDMCMDCRKSKCKTCGRLWAPVNAGASECSSCLTNRRERGNRYAEGA